MTVSRASRLGSSLGRTFMRRPGTQARTQTWRQAGHRFYASEHTSKSSELPWIIGSVALTTPAAVWLWSQGPSGGAHGHDEPHEKPEDKEEGSEDKGDEQADTQDESKDEKPAKEEKDDTKEEDKSEEKSDQKSDDSASGDDDSDGSEKGEAKDTPPSSDDSGSDDDGQYEKPGPNAPGQINYRPGLGKGPGEGQKVGTRKPTEKKGEKDSAKDFSGAKHPYLDDPEKSKKAEGITDTAKIHGTVDPSRSGK